MHQPQASKTKWALCSQLNTGKQRLLFCFLTSCSFGLVGVGYKVLHERVCLQFNDCSGSDGSAWTRSGLYKLWCSVSGLSERLFGVMFPRACVQAVPNPCKCACWHLLAVMLWRAVCCTASKTSSKAGMETEQPSAHICLYFYFCIRLCFCGAMKI